MVGRGRRLRVLILVALVGCRREATTPRPPPSELRHDLELTAEQAAYLDGLEREADQNPERFAARKASGMAHLRFTLSGVLSLRDRAELDLEAAFALDPSDRELTRTLGRFYNLRAVAGDDSKAAAQVEVYRAHLGDRPVAEMSTSDFVAYAFSQLGAILSHRNAGRMLKALSSVKALEDELRERAEAAPDDVELWALAGNFAFFFAGNVPFGRRERVQAAVAYFDHVRERWDELRDGARDPDHCPNTYENFMFELAEGHLVLEDLAAARELYEMLSTVRPPVTRAKEQIAFVAGERLGNLERYAGEMALMPPWPSDVGNCVVCHAYTSDVPLTTLHVVDPIVLSDIPTAAVTKPLPPVGPLPPNVRKVVSQRCFPCHTHGGESQELADFTTDEGVLARGRAIVRRVASGTMPPGQSLSASESDTLTQWLTVEP